MSPNHLEYLGWVAKVRQKKEGQPGVEMGLPHIPDYELRVQKHLEQLGFLLHPHRVIRQTTLEHPLSFLEVDAILVDPETGRLLAVAEFKLANEQMKHTQERLEKGQRQLWLRSGLLRGMVPDIRQVLIVVETPRRPAPTALRELNLESVRTQDPHYAYIYNIRVEDLPMLDQIEKGATE